MTQTEHLGLTLTSASDDQLNFIDWRQQLDGDNGSNMQKIDAAIGGHRTAQVTDAEGVHGVRYDGTHIQCQNEDGSWTNAAGEAGPEGYSPTVTLTETEAGVQITVQNKDATSSVVVQNGAAGPAGADGYSPSVTLTPTEAGVQITVQDAEGSSTETVLHGAQGEAGPAPVITVGTVSTGDPGTNASAEITGTSPNLTLHLTIPRGATGAVGATGAAGADGQSPTITMGTVTTGAAGSIASATLTGTYPNYTLNLTIPKGDTGAAGTTPTSMAATEITGTMTVAQGGTGRSTLTSGYFLRGNGTGAVTLSAPASARSAMGLGSSTGVLGVAYGGTGVASIAALKTALGITDSAGFVCGTYTADGGEISDGSADVTGRTITLGLRPKFVFVTAQTKKWPMSWYWDYTDYDDTQWTDYTGKYAREQEFTSYHGYATDGGPMSVRTAQNVTINLLEIVDTGFVVKNLSEKITDDATRYYNRESNHVYLNFKADTYFYIAIK